MSNTLCNNKDNNQPKLATRITEQLPCRVRKWNFSPFFSAKGVVKLGVKFWRNFPCYVFQGLGVRRKISQIFHVKTVWKTGSFTQISFCWGAALKNDRSNNTIQRESTQNNPNTKNITTHGTISVFSLFFGGGGGWGGCSTCLTAPPPRRPLLLVYNLCCGVVIWAKFGLLRCYYLGQVCFFTKHCVKKHNKIGVWALFLKKERAQIWGVIIWAKLAILSCNQLGPDNNTYLAQIRTPQNGIFLFFCAFKNVLKYLFYSVFEHQPKLAKNVGKKNDNFSHFAKHSFTKKKRFVATPLLTKNWCFWTLNFWNQKHWCWTKNIT